VVLAGLLVLLLAASETRRTVLWNYQSEDRTPENWNGVKIAVNPQIKTPDGKTVLELMPEYGRDDLQYQSYLTFMVRSEVLKTAKAVEISFWAKGEKGAEIALRVTSDRATHCSPTRAFPMNGEWQRIQYRETMFGPVGGKWACAPRLLLEKDKAGQRFFLGPVRLKLID